MKKKYVVEPNLTDKKNELLRVYNLYKEILAIIFLVGHGQAFLKDLCRLLKVHNSNFQYIVKILEDAKLLHTKTLYRNKVLFLNRNAAKLIIKDYEDKIHFSVSSGTSNIFGNTKDIGRRLVKSNFCFYLVHVIFTTKEVDVKNKSEIINYIIQSNYYSNIFFIKNDIMCNYTLIRRKNNKRDGYKEEIAYQDGKTQKQIDDINEEIREWNNYKNIDFTKMNIYIMDARIENRFFETITFGILVENTMDKEDFKYIFELLSRFLEEAHRQDILKMNIIFFPQSEPQQKYLQKFLQDQKQYISTKLTATKFDIKVGDKFLKHYKIDINRSM